MLIAVIDEFVPFAEEYGKYHLLYDFVGYGGNGVKLAVAIASANKIKAKSLDILYNLPKKCRDVVSA